MVDNPASFLKYIVWTVLSLALTVAYTDPLLSRLGFGATQDPSKVVLRVDRIVETPRGVQAATPTTTAVPKANMGAPLLPLPGESGTVIYTSAGFEPLTIKLRTGETLRFRNNSPYAMRIVIEPLEKNTGESITAPYSIASGSAFDLVMNSEGSFRYHNLNRSGDYGFIVVR